MMGRSTVKPAKSATAAKTQRPHEVFERPADVVADPALSKQDKRVALESLEQDARQLATASGEGMSDGETTDLHDVLVAKHQLDRPAEDAAFATVQRILEAKLTASRGTSAQRVIEEAIDRLNAARNAIERMDPPPRMPAGAAKPGSKRELEEELAKEKLDP